MTQSEAVRAAVLVAPSRIELRTFPRPRTGPDDALLLVEANGICGTDVHFRASEQDVPRVLGHEVVGRIVEIGDRAAERWQVALGERVAVEAGIACGSCPDCVAGFSQTCASRRSYGSNITTAVAPSLWGGLAELMYLSPGTGLTKLDARIPADVAAGWFSPLANAIDWTGPVGGDVQPGDVVVVLGPGPQGLAAVLAAKARGAATVLLAGLSRDGRRLAAGRTLGADRVVAVDERPILDEVRAATGGELAHVVVDVSGSAASARVAPLLLRRRGTVVAASPINVSDDVGLPLKDMIWRQIRWQGVLSNRAAATPGAAHLLARNLDLLRPLVTHRYPLDGADHAIDVVAGVLPDEDAIKVVVCPDEGASS
jgi:threonine dehydrogenase-like Zn-dependent dehydrogenase